MKCFCGCEGQVVAQHHVFYQQHLRELSERGPRRGVKLRPLIEDRRNLVPVAFRCHQRHHGAHRRYELVRLPDSVFEFGREVFGAGPAYEYLRRRYKGEDPRLDALLEDAYPSIDAGAA